MDLTDLKKKSCYVFQFKKNVWTIIGSFSEVICLGYFKPYPFKNMVHIWPKENMIS